MIERNYIVYIHQNKINNKMYVGLTKNLKERWKSNGKNYKESPKFYNAIKKYGWNNFYHIIIASNLTREEACNFEILLINKLCTTDDKYGYNISKGGDSFTMTEELKDKLSKLCKERFSGKHNTENQNKRISESRIKFSGCVNGKTKIICIEDGLVFESVTLASKYYNIPHSSISNVLNKKRNHTHNLHFDYVK